MATGSFVPNRGNFVDIIQLNQDKTALERVGTFEHSYPPTQLAWIPDRTGRLCDMLATTSDCLRLWGPEVGSSNKFKLKAELTSSSGFTAPLTSFDWNECNPDIIGTASIDTTCTIWNLEKGKTITQLIAHDKEVYDIAFSNRWPDVFASVGADGSVRMFDLRTLEYSTVIYETLDLTALVRLAWNKQDPNYIATIMAESPTAIILDIRVPSVANAELTRHQKNLNSLSWAPHSPSLLCTASDDKQALIWEMSTADPLLSYTASTAINQLQWSSAHPEWVSIAFEKQIQMLRVGL